VTLRNAFLAESKSRAEIALACVVTHNEFLSRSHPKIPVKIPALSGAALPIRELLRTPDAAPYFIELDSPGLDVLNDCDSFRPYQSIVRKYPLGRLDFATMQKLFATPFNVNAEAARRYSPATRIGVKVRIQAGAPREDRINTSFVERANLSVRHSNKRFARLGLGYSRKLVNHEHAISLFVCAYNFCKKHSTLGCSPAVGLKLATETWTIERLIEEATK